MITPAILIIIFQSFLIINVECTRRVDGLIEKFVLPEYAEGFPVRIWSLKSKRVKKQLMINGHIEVYSDFGEGVEINLEINKSITDQVNSSDLIRLKRDLSDTRLEDFQDRIDNRRISHGRQRNYRNRRADRVFSAWSNWGKCDIFCRQKRERVCVQRRKCGSIKQMEERDCSFDACELIRMNNLNYHDDGPKFNVPPRRQQKNLNLDQSESKDIVIRKRKKNKKKPIVIEIDDDDQDEYDQEEEYKRDYKLKNNRRSHRITNKDRLLLKVIKQGGPKNNNAHLRRSDTNDDDAHEFFLPRNITDYDTPSIWKDIHLQTPIQAFPVAPPQPQSLIGDDLVSTDDDDDFEIKEKAGKTKAVFETPRKPISQYSKWSRWSKCSPKCTTRRFKKCRPHARHICGNDIIREVAYCYTEGSFCEEWINSQLHQLSKNPIEVQQKPTKPHKPKLERRTESPHLNSVSQNFGGYWNPNKNRANWSPQFKPQNIQCGFPSIRKKGNNLALKILGGKMSKRGQWPWQVVILNRYKEPFCGGTLIAPDWVITASHCVRKKLYVRLGEYNLSVDDGSEVELKIVRSIKHPKYNRTTVDNDIAMLRLPRSVERGHYIGFACLPERFQQLPVGHMCTILGWGKRRHNDDAGTDLLHEAEVPIISNDECKNVYYDYTITRNMFCAGHKRGRIDTCAGDSGGPILCRDYKKPNRPWTIYGITSFGDGCGKKNKFGIYAKIPNYVDWIWSIINCNGNCKS